MVEIASPGENSFLERAEKSPSPEKYGDAPKNPYYFRLVDGVLEYRPGEFIRTSTDLESRGELLRRYGLQAVLTEVAAQSCGLLSRLDERGRRDCFLGKIKKMTFRETSAVSRVTVSARAIFTSDELASYRGEIRAQDGGLAADFDLLICMTENVGGDAEERSAYWRRYLDSVMARELDPSVRPDASAADPD